MNVTSTQMAITKNDNWIRKFDVTDPVKHKNGFTVYRVSSVVFPKSAPEAVTKVVVWKRYNDFKKLYKSLRPVHKQWNINEELPKLCNGRFFERFEKSIINDRINFALELLNFIGRHQCLFTCEPFIQFFNNGYQVPDSQAQGFEVSENELNSGWSRDKPCDNKRCSGDGETCEKQFSDESISLGHDYSDEDSASVSVTPCSISSVQSMSSISSAKENLSDKCNNNNLNDEILKFEDNKKTVVPAKSGSLWQGGSAFGVEDANRAALDWEGERVGSLVQGPGSSDSESWLTPPGTPSTQHDYLVEAAQLMGQAQRYEVEGDLAAAFYFYKSAVASLLGGAEEEKESWRRQAVRSKADLFLHRAHRIHAMCLKACRGTDAKGVTDDVNGLNSYKVLKIIDSKVMLVINIFDKKKYVIKVLEKSPCPVDANRKTNIPPNVPYMVKLYEYFENENSIFLVLQYVAGGKLWDRLRDPSLFLLPNEECARRPNVSRTPAECAQCLESVTGEVLAEPESFVGKKEAESLRTEGGFERGRIGGTSSKAAFEYNLMKSEEEDQGDPDVMSLVKNSQELLLSVNKTLATSEKLTSDLNKELMNIETNCRLLCGNVGSETVEQRQRSRSANPKPKFEKCFSCEDLSEGKPRVTSSSLDRRGGAGIPNTSASLPPESTVRRWAAEILVALETLHRHGIICRDLRPGNLLVSPRGGILLTFQSHWRGVDPHVSEDAVSGLYAAPELLSVFPVTSAVDWWTFGALLYELLTGRSLASCYPEGILRHTVVSVPDFVSPEAESLLKELLRYEASERLGSGVNGPEDIKSHPFFDQVDWQNIYDNL